MVPIRWDKDIAGGPSGQAGVDERASAARLGLLRYPAAVLGRLNDNIAEVRHALIELNDLRPDLADHGHLVVYQQAFRHSHPIPHADDLFSKPFRVFWVEYSCTALVDQVPIRIESFRIRSWAKAIFTTASCQPIALALDVSQILISPRKGSTLLRSMCSFVCQALSREPCLASSSWALTMAASAMACVLSLVRSPRFRRLRLFRKESRCFESI